MSSRSIPNKQKVRKISKTPSHKPNKTREEAETANQSNPITRLSNSQLFLILISQKSLHARKTRTLKTKQKKNSTFSIIKK